MKRNNKDLFSNRKTYKDIAQDSFIDILAGKDRWDNLVDKYLNEIFSKRSTDRPVTILTGEGGMKMFNQILKDQFSNFKNNG